MSWHDALINALFGSTGAELSPAAIDLESWEEETHQLLPNNLTAEDIARFEQAGWIVDLETGQLIREADANAYTVNIDGLGV